MSTEWSTMVNSIFHLFVHSAVFAVLTLGLFLITKIFNEFDEDTDIGDPYSMETDPLLPAKTVSTTCDYGTISSEDIEKANCSISSDMNKNNDNSDNSSEDLYDGKLCIVCYDEQRDCFFVPCGHCATCHVCARRIFYGENKTCPVCRRAIGKVSTLFPS